MSSTDIAIVIVHWNVAELLDACLDSIRNEIDNSHLTCEVVVVDSASPDSAYREVMERHRWAMLIESRENLGYAGGNNLGIAETSAPAVLILNPDTVLRPGALAHLHRTLHISPHIGLVAPILLNSDGSTQSTGYQFPGIANVWLDFFPIHPRIYGSSLNGRIDPGAGELPYAIDYPLGAAMMVKRDALVDAGGFDTGYELNSEEIDLCKRLDEKGWTRVLDPRARITHIGGRSTGQRPDHAHELLWTSRARYYRLWGTRFERTLVWAGIELGTRVQDRNATPQRREINQRLRTQFRRLH